MGKIKRKALQQVERARCSLSDHAICLIYHRVANLEMDHQLLAVKPERFRQQLLHLKDHFPILSPLELHGHLESGNVPCNAIVLTFDDGYADNYLEMLPIVEDLKIPVTVFVSTDLLGTTREFWWDELERLFLSLSTQPAHLDFPWQGKQLHMATDTPQARRSAYQKVHPMVKRLKPAEREAVLDLLRKWAGTDTMGRPTHRSMTVSELVLLSKVPHITIGAHTCSHTALSVLSPEEQALEMSESKRILEEAIGSEVEFFSYPFGAKPDYTLETPSICRRSGFKGSYSNFYGHIFKSTDPYQVPRILVRDWKIEEFRKRVDGFLKS